MPAGGPDVLAPIAWLPAVEVAVQDARRAVDRLRAHRSQRRFSVQLAAESALHGAKLAAGLEMGDAHSLSAADMRQMSGAAELAGAKDPRRLAAIGALRAYSELPRLTAIWARSPLQVLARLHMLAARGTVAEPMLGRPRAADGGPGPSAIDVSRRLLDLGDCLGRTRAPALVVAAVVHAEIATIQPFAWGNTIVAMAAQRLTFAQLGLDPGLHAVPEVGHATPEGAYESALAAYVQGSAEGVTAWVRHVADALVAGAQQGIATGESIARGA